MSARAYPDLSLTERGEHAGNGSNDAGPTGSGKYVAKSENDNRQHEGRNVGGPDAGFLLVRPLHGIAQVNDGSDHGKTDDPSNEKLLQSGHADQRRFHPSILLLGARVGRSLHRKGHPMQRSVRRLRPARKGSPWACSHYPNGWRCARKAPQARRRTLTLAIPRRGRQRSLRRLSPQPAGTGPVLPISASLVARRRPVCVAPRSWNSAKPAPVATVRVV